MNFTRHYMVQLIMTFYYTTWYQQVATMWLLSLLERIVKYPLNYTLLVEKEKKGEKIHWVM